jgi:hypothetical protein
VPLHLEAWETVFVVFRHPTAHTSRTIPLPTQKHLATIEGPWTVNFQPDRGAPPSITLTNLTSWSDNADSGVKYFSGTASYVKTLEARSDWFTPANHLWIDLGEVKNLADISVNGKSLGIVWHSPYRVDVTKALKPGENRIVIQVTNSWVNRIIGDQQPGADKKYTFPDMVAFKASSPLLPSGLLGPVELYAAGTQ